MRNVGGRGGFFGSRRPSRTRSPWFWSPEPAYRISKPRAVVLSVVAGLIALIVIVDARLAPALTQMAEAKAMVIATEAINNAVNKNIALSIRYEDLMAFKLDGHGNVVAVQPNTGEINRLASETTLQVQNTLAQVKRAKISIPLGQVFGTQVLATLGPQIPVNVVPIGTVTSKVVDTFETAGINQIRHRISVEIETMVRVVVPLSMRYVKVKTEVPITEAVLLGEVPQVYVDLNGKSAERILGLSGGEATSGAGGGR